MATNLRFGAGFCRVSCQPEQRAPSIRPPTRQRCLCVHDWRGRGGWRSVVALAPVNAAVAARNHPHCGAPYGAPRLQSPNETPVARAVNTVS